MFTKAFWISFPICMVLGSLLLHFSPDGAWWIEMLACCTIYAAVHAVVRDVLKLREQSKRDRQAGVR